MTTTITKKQDIAYWALDFKDLFERFVEHAKAHYPDQYKDFSKTSHGTMIAEFLCFVGDVNNFRIDHNYGEWFLDHATEPATLFRRANSEGYKIPGKTPASGKISMYMTVPAVVSGSYYAPDLSYALTVKRNSTVFKRGQPYELTEDIDFSDINIRDRSQVVIKSHNSNGTPSYFALKKQGNVVAGQTTTYSVTVGSYEEYRVITLPGSDISQIISVVDSDGNTWYEVDFLANDMVFINAINTAYDTDLVQNVLVARPAPYRFVVLRNPTTRKWELHFGAGSADDTDQDVIPNTGDMAIPLYGKSHFVDPVIDPSNFLKTQTLGMAPANTTLTIKYRTGGGSSTNAAVNEITTTGDIKYDVSTSGLDAGIIADVVQSISVTNTEPVSGGLDGLSIEQLRRMIKAFKSAQMRCVSPEDYVFKAYAMPSEFGSVFRAYARRNNLNKNIMQLYILSKDQYGHLQNCTTTLKTNLQTYFKNTTMDSVDMLDVNIVNLSILFSVKSDGTRNSSELLTECIKKLKQYFDIEKWQIGQPIILSKISDLLDDISGVYAVSGINIVARNGTFENRTYSNLMFGVESNTKNGIVYPKRNMMFEVKYLDHDIKGKVV